MTTELTTTAPVVTIRNGQAFTNSRDVAATFARLHKNVLQAIQNLECSQEFARLNFQPWEIPHPTVRGRKVMTYDMTKDGFTFLAMGFTGPIAARFKELYIAAFNELEAKASAASNASVMALPDFTNPAAAARAWADEVEQKQALQIENQRLLPMARIGEKAANSQHTLTRSLDIAGPNSFGLL